MNLKPDEIKHLLWPVCTKSQVGHYDDGDNWDLPIYNWDERIEAAEKLANAGVTEALSAIQDYFVEYLLMVVSGDKNRDRIRRIGKALIILGGEETFSSMMLAQVIPTLDNLTIECRKYLSEYMAGRGQAERLSFLRLTFGNIGDWAGHVPVSLAEQKYVYDEEEKRRRKQYEIDCAVAKRNFSRLLAADEERRLAIQRERKSKGQCIMCGKPLGLVRRLTGTEQHWKCFDFTE